MLPVASCALDRPRRDVERHKAHHRVATVAAGTVDVGRADDGAAVAAEAVEAVLVGGDEEAVGAEIVGHCVLLGLDG